MLLWTPHFRRELHILVGLRAYILDREEEEVDDVAGSS